jgi:membrane associated rhomboid family serine protease
MPIVAADYFPYATIGLLLACAATTLAFAASGNSEHFICFPREPFQEFGLPTLLSLFTHENFAHLLTNGILLFLAGAALEKRIGPGTLLALFLLCGFAGIAGQAAVTSVATIGASGAICGLVAVYLATQPAGERAGLLPYACLLWFAVDFLGFQAQKAGAGGWIGHGAHVGGALAGLALGQLAAFRGTEKRPPGRA